jgi:glucosamine 6-phosphate synthetase-like amidotransferase/phosphosugar isomerase protein
MFVLLKIGTVSLTREQLGYRGYDSAGIATLGSEHLFAHNQVKLHNLESNLRTRPLYGPIGIRRGERPLSGLMMRPPKALP